jgi:hypothetical protein
MRIVEEHYLRDDIGLGTLHGEATPLTVEGLLQLVEEKGGGEGKKGKVSILDTNVALEQLDFLENKEVCVCVCVCVCNCIFLYLHHLPLHSPTYTHTHTHTYTYLQASTSVLGIIVLLQTVIEEVRANSLAAYRRLQKLLRDEERMVVFFSNEHHAETYR